MLTQENTLVYHFREADEEALKEIMDRVIVVLNQNTIWWKSRRYRMLIMAAKRKKRRRQQMTKTENNILLIRLHFAGRLPTYLSKPAGRLFFLCVFDFDLRHCGAAYDTDFWQAVAEASKKHMDKRWYFVGYFKPEPACREKRNIPSCTVKCELSGILDNYYGTASYAVFQAETK